MTDATDDETASVSVVHILFGGLALCGLAGFPGEWPPGNRWVGLNDPRHLQLANCPGCLDKVRACK